MKTFNIVVSILALLVHAFLFFAWSGKTPSGSSQSATTEQRPSNYQGFGK